MTKNIIFIIAALCSLQARAPTVKVWKEELETLRQSYAEQAPRLIPLRDELLKLSQVQHNVDLLLREREERHHSEISR